MRRTIVALCIAGYFLLATGSAPAADSACTCDDMAHVQQRIQVVSAAVNAYTDQLLRTPADTPYTPAGHNAVEAAVGQAVNGPATSLGSPFVANPPAQTTAKVFGCRVKILDEGATACMKASLQTHEAVHHAACERTWGYFNTYKLLNDFIKEEIEAYTAERDFLLDQRYRLMCSCPYYALHFDGLGETNLAFPNETLSGQGQTESAGKAGVDIPLTIHGASVNGHAQTTINNHVTGTGMSDCRLNTQTPLNLEVTGQFTEGPVLHANLTGNPVNETESGECTEPGKRVSINSTQTADSRTIPFNIFQLDSPVSKAFALAPGIEWTLTSTLLVDDPWPNTKASNGRGSTVGEALHRIGMPFCAQ